MPKKKDINGRARRRAVIGNSAARRRRGGATRAPGHQGRSHAVLSEHFDDVVMARELFWNNVIREILTALSTLAIAGADAAAEGALPLAPGVSPTDPLDGRLALVTSAGERIPIAEVYPLFACGIPGSESERVLSMAVECTVFQVRTPAGEVYTLPLHEIRGFHALTQDLMNQISQAAAGANPGTGEPFGFAAFTELSRSQAMTRDQSNPPEVSGGGRHAAGAD